MKKIYLHKWIFCFMMIASTCYPASLLWSEEPLAPEAVTAPQAIAEPVEAVAPQAEPAAEEVAEPAPVEAEIRQALNAQDAQLQEDETLPPGMQNLISLDLRGLDIKDALKYLSLNGGLNIVVSKNVSGSLSFIVADVPIKDVFDVILRSNALAYEKRGNVYSVMTESEYQERYGRQFSDVRQVKIFNLKYAIPENVFTVVDALKSDIGRVVVDQETGTVLVMDTPQKLIEIEQGVAALEKKDFIQVFDLKYANAMDIEEQLKNRLDSKNVGSVQADERSNQLIVKTLPERMKDIALIIAALDQKTREVLIDAKIIKLILTDDTNIGIEWEGLMQILTRRGGVDFIGSHPFNSLDRLGASFIDQYATRVASTTNLDPRDNVFTSTGLPVTGRKTASSEKIYFGKTDKWEAVLNFLQSIGETKLLSNPKLSVVNNQEAKIHVGRREVYVTTTTTAGTQTNTISEEVNFIDVGIQLAVTPTINSDGFVTMKIKPEVSSVVDTYTTPTNNLIPIIDTSIAETTVVVKDNSTVVIGGLRKTEEVTSTSQPPFLANLPLLGMLLKHQTTDKEQTELLILLTPTVVSGEVLVTGDLREPGEEGIQNYREYTAVDEDRLEEEIDLGPMLNIDVLGLKTYRDYTADQTESE
ncbi:MAG: secretin N-terminal domain-containing protein [Candidatus Omnitrophota bacterium]